MSIYRIIEIHKGRSGRYPRSAELDVCPHAGIRPLHWPRMAQKGNIFDMLAIERDVSPSRSMWVESHVAVPSRGHIKN